MRRRLVGGDGSVITVDFIEPEKGRIINGTDDVKPQIPGLFSGFRGVESHKF
jgi:hypothetical protein